MLLFPFHLCQENKCKLSSLWWVCFLRTGVYLCVCGGVLEEVFFSSHYVSQKEKLAEHLSISKKKEKRNNSEKDKEEREREDKEKTRILPSTLFPQKATHDFIVGYLAVNTKWPLKTENRNRGLGSASWNRNICIRQNDVCPIYSTPKRNAPVFISTA